MKNMKMKVARKMTPNISSFIFEKTYVQLQLVRFLLRVQEIFLKSDEFIIKNEMK